LSPDLYIQKNKHKREVDLVVVHCTATYEGKDLDVEDIRKMHKRRGWSDCGYHFIITLSGEVQIGRPLEKMGAHVRGHNKGSIGISYIGGVDLNNKPKDTRTDAQKISMINLIDSLRSAFRNVEVKGHRDLSPDMDGDGIVERHEWVKACPCFDAIKEYETIT